MMKLKVNISNENNINTNNFADDAPAFLGKHEYARLYEAIHTSQLGLFKEVLLRSLKVLHEVLREVPVEGQSNMSLFDLKINELCAAFKRLNSLPDLYSKEAETFRNIAVTAFVFYRTLYKGAYEAFIQHAHTKIHFDVDKEVLFKRIPYKLYDFLGSEYWRIYEFYELVNGDLTKAKLNEGIKDFIQIGCAEINKPAEKPVNQMRPNTSASLEIDQNTQMRLLEEEDQAIAESLLQEFTAWVQEQLDKDYLHLNERGIFSSSLKYGTDLFIEESVLNQFAILYQKNNRTLKQILLTAVDGCIYKVQKNEKALKVYRIKGLRFIDNEYNPQMIVEEK